MQGERKDDLLDWPGHWFTREWWRYLLAPREWGYVSWPRTIWCRMRGHPAGVYWYSSGFEPDMHCKECGDDLG